MVPGGARVPGTQFVLDPVKAAFNIGAMVRWLDFNDTWLAAEWGHPSDNLGGILAVADWLAAQRRAGARRRSTVRDVLTAMIKAHEIQGVLALENSFNRVGLDHVVLVKVATTAVVTGLLGERGDERRGLLAAELHVGVGGFAILGRRLVDRRGASVLGCHGNVPPAAQNRRRNVVIWFVRSCRFSACASPFCATSEASARRAQACHLGDTADRWAGAAPSAGRAVGHHSRRTCDGPFRSVRDGYLRRTRGSRTRVRRSPVLRWMRA